MTDNQRTCNIVTRMVYSYIETTANNMVDHCQLIICHITHTDLLSFILLRFGTTAFPGIILPWRFPRQTSVLTFRILFNNRKDMNDVMMVLCGQQPGQPGLAGQPAQLQRSQSLTDYVFVILPGWAIDATPVERIIKMNDENDEIVKLSIHMKMNQLYDWHHVRNFKFVLACFSPFKSRGKFVLMYKKI